MANSQTWRCAVCGSTNTIADAECETCRSPRATASAGPAEGVARGVRVEASRGHGPNSPYAAMLAETEPATPGPAYRPAPRAGGPGLSRAAVGWAAGLATAAALFFLYQYLQSGRAAPQAGATAPVQAPAPAPPASVDHATWAASASAADLRAAIAAGGERAAAARNELGAREDLAWSGAVGDGSIERLAAFLQEWPDGARAGEARTRIRSLVAMLPSAPFSRRVVSSVRAPMREAPASNAAVIAYVDADQVIAPRRLVRNNSQYWFVLTHEDGRPAYVSYNGFRYADRAPMIAPPPMRPAPRVSVTPPPGAAASMPSAAIREARPARAIRVEYPARARGGETGIVEVEFIVTVSGRAPADFIEILSESPRGRGFGDAVRQALAQTRFTPRMVNGAPEPSRVRRTFHIPPP